MYAKKVKSILNLVLNNGYLDFFSKKKEITGCETIPVIKFTTFKIGSNFVESDYVIFDCIPGYELIRGDRIRMCNLNGKWRGHDIECVSK